MFLLFLAAAVAGVIVTVAAGTTVRCRPTTAGRNRPVTTVNLTAAMTEGVTVVDGEVAAGAVAAMTTEAAVVVDDLRQPRTGPSLYRATSAPSSSCSVAATAPAASTLTVTRISRWTQPETTSRRRLKSSQISPSLRLSRKKDR